MASEFAARQKSDGQLLTTGVRMSSSSLVEGKSLQQVLEERGDPGLAFGAVVGYLRQVAAALDHLHAHEPPVVHGDVKPSNLILTRGARSSWSTSGWR